MAKKSRRTRKAQFLAAIDSLIPRARKLLAVLDKDDAVRYLIAQGVATDDAFLAVSAALIMEKHA